MEDIQDIISSYNEEALLADGFDEAIVGMASRCAMNPVVVYDTEKVISILMEQGMDEDEAIEYFEFNIAGAYVGENGPIFLHTLTEE